jgi:PST family polysaccharide transporter
MRATFESTAGLLGAVTLPACVVLAASAGPLIGLVYGPVWRPAAAVLAALGLLAALRILFELVYDYFVVLANTRVVFTVQVIWLVALIPALYAGARLGGPAGAGAAQLAVAAAVVAPIYLYELRRTGVMPSALARRLAMPVLASGCVGVCAVLAATLVAVKLVAVLIAGSAALAALGLLMYRMRGSFSALRSLGEEPLAAEPVEAATPI